MIASARVSAEGPNEACGLFGVWAPGEEVARLTYFGLFALQHRGQESAGISVSDGRAILVFKELGLVSQVFNEATLATLQGELGIGHTRYSTTGSNTWDNAQPAFKTDGRRGLALGHNGNLVNTAELAERAGWRGGATTDSDLVATLLAEHLGEGLEVAAMRVLPTLEGAFSFVMMDERTVFAARDPHGLRPLSIGKLPGGFCFASETAALDIVGATFVRDVEPGELVMVDDEGLRSRRFAESPRRALCLFEFVYLARADSRLYGRTVLSARREMGRRLALQAPADADLVIPIPDTGHAAAQGYAEEAGLPYGEGLMKNRYVGRTFIEPTPSLRSRGVKLKLNPMPEAVRGRRLVVVDDSIVRGTTTRQIVQTLREAGAAAVHLRVTSPPVRWPCFYGIDMSTRKELVATDLTVDEVREFIGADSLGYLELEALVEATGSPADSFCRACFDGKYPVPVPEREPTKFALEEEPAGRPSPP
ncbi:MAG: amidophosphoribosyltransferase [Actinobacteria bacterium]|nr:amidophosphoribosyltransferase [Actinomycetota bacterium]